MTVEQEIINERAAQLEEIGFVIKVTGDQIWYEKDGVKMIPTLMMCASRKEWDEWYNSQKQ